MCGDGADVILPKLLLAAKAYGSVHRKAPLPSPAWAWYRAELYWNATQAPLEVRVDAKNIPALHALDLTLHSGKVGLGSFNETADFKNVNIEGPRTVRRTAQ